MAAVLRKLKCPLLIAILAAEFPFPAHCYNTIGNGYGSKWSDDANVDGVVDAADYAAWNAHYGNVPLAGLREQEWPMAPLSTTTVPEPWTMVAILAAAGACSILGSIRRRFRRGLALA